MTEDVTFCAYEDCPNVNCLRFHKNAPKEYPCSWFAVRPKENEKCDYFLRGIDGEIKNENKNYN